MVEADNKQLNIRRQCELLSVSRSRLYYRARPVDEENLRIMNFIDEEFTEHPFTGVERMAELLRREHCLAVNHKRVRRLMRKMGLVAVYPKPRTSFPAPVYIKYSCLIGNLAIEAPDAVWCSDITYIRLRGGFMYLVAIMDYFSRYVLSWSVSNTLESLFCLDALDEALAISRPGIFHSDQGKQYSSTKFVDALKKNEIRISMSGRGRAYDNILVERLWRTVKYEEIYLREYADGHELIRSLRRYFEYYNNRRPHTALNYGTPAEAYFGNRESAASRSACGGHTATSLFIAHSRSAAGPSDTQLLAYQAKEIGKSEMKKSLQLTPYSGQNLVLTMGSG
jgi:putative transposase